LVATITRLITPSPAAIETGIDIEPALGFPSSGDTGDQSHHDNNDTSSATHHSSSPEGAIGPMVAETSSA
jgi:hypothetical protein